jgi:sugar-specific transcriptional regulator TrmB
MGGSCSLSFENEVQTLMKFGLTATQAKAYLCLNAMGTSEAKSIVQTSKIPRQDIYRILDELFEKGLVEKVFAKPVEFRAISPGECLKLLVQRRTNETENLKNEASKVFDACHTAVKKRKTESRTVLVPPREPVLSKAAELIVSLKKSLFVLAPPHKLFPWIFAHQELFEEAIRRNVMLRFVTMKTERGALPKFLGRSRSGSLLETRFVLERPSLSFGIYDDRTVILELSADDGYLESQAIVSDNQCLVGLASVCFESMWMQADDCSFHY